MAQRAKWSSKYEKGLVFVLSQYKTSHFVDRMVGPQKGGDVSLKILINNLKKQDS
jgi:hypothetical protein